jgi:pyruvate dehydrogenase E2 component (dihydrolipoamide acetyltransferase)
MPDIDFSQFGEVDVVPLNRIKKLTAANLRRAWLNVPHVTQHEEADITELEEFRQELKKEAADRGVRVTMLAFLMKACVAALREYPRFNASLEKGGENLIIKKYYNIGIAVDTPDGLVVPAIRNVDRKGIYDLANELGEVSKRARDKKLSPSDLQGACFTISSLGGIGGTAFTPIVNAPEVAILGVSKAQMKPVYQDGEFVPRLMLPLALSYDHRVVDGAEGARFVVFLSKVLEDARRLLL